MSVAPIYTTVGHTGNDELHFRGHAVFASLLGKVSLSQLEGLSMSGKLQTREELVALDDIVTALSSADARLWPFKIARIGASASGHASYGVACTLASGEGGVFGPNRMRECVSFFLGLTAKANNGEPTDDEIVRALDSGNQGFGVLYRVRDERLHALLEQTTKRGRHTLPYTRLCLRVIELARANKGLEPHVYLGIAALALDLGWSADAIAALALYIIFHDALPNAAEGAQQKPRVLQEASYTKHVRYEGQAPRLSYKALPLSSE